MDGIRFRLNGEEQCYEGSAADRLLDVLRDTFRMTSVKCGCKEGECGACAVLMDGRLVNSCCVAMGAAEGAEIVTLEGYRKTDRFRILDKAFGEATAVQCGFCIPGMGPGRRSPSQKKSPSHGGRNPGGDLRQPVPVYRVQRNCKSH